MIGQFERVFYLIMIGTWERVFQTNPDWHSCAGLWGPFTQSRLTRVWKQLTQLRLAFQQLWDIYTVTRAAATALFVWRWFAFNDSSLSRALWYQLQYCIMTLMAGEPQRTILERPVWTGLERSIMRKSSAPFSIVGWLIWNGTLIRGNTQFKEELTNVVHQYTKSIVIGSFEKALPLFERTCQISSPSKENGAELYSLIVHSLIVICFNILYFIRI